jgi:hypothetical protein
VNRSKRKSSTPKLVACGWSYQESEGYCWGCNRQNRRLKDVELHWADKRDNWVSWCPLCPRCAATCVAALEDGVDPIALFGVRYPFVS